MMVNPSIDLNEVVRLLVDVDASRTTVDDALRRVDDLAEFETIAADIEREEAAGGRPA